MATGQLKAITSFYALHEVLVFATRNAPDLISGCNVGKAALVELLRTPLTILPMLTREEKILNLRTFATLADSSDTSHAITAYRAGCTIIVSYDEHFKDLPPVLTWRKPEDLLADLGQPKSA